MAWGVGLGVGARAGCRAPRRRLAASHPRRVRDRGAVPSALASATFALTNAAAWCHFAAARACGDTAPRVPTRFSAAFSGEACASRQARAGRGTRRGMLGVRPQLTVANMRTPRVGRWTRGGWRASRTRHHPTLVWKGSEGERRPTIRWLAARANLGGGACAADPAPGPGAAGHVPPTRVVRARVQKRESAEEDGRGHQRRLGLGGLGGSACGCRESAAAALVQTWSSRSPRDAFGLVRRMTPAHSGWPAGGALR